MIVFALTKHLFASDMRVIGIRIKRYWPTILQHRHDSNPSSDIPYNRRFCTYPLPICSPYRRRGVVYYTSPYAAQRTCIVIFAGVVVHILPDEEAIAGTSAFRPGMKHIILDISVYPVDLHVHMVCYIAVAWVHHHLTAPRPISLPERVQGWYLVPSPCKSALSRR